MPMTIKPGLILCQLGTEYRISSQVERLELWTPVSYPLSKLR